MPSNQYFAYRSFWPELGTVGKFAAAGVDTVCIFPANTMNSLGEPYCKYPPNWLWFDRYDFSAVDRQIGDLLAVNPQAEFLCMVDLNSPAWLARQLSLFHDGDSDSFTQLTEALCHPEWRKNTFAYLRHFLGHCEKHHAKVIKSYILACGHTDEWLDYTAGAAGPTKAAAYREWRGRHHLPDGHAPAASRLDETSFDGLLHDPQGGRELLDYWRFTNEVVSGAIADFAAETRKLVRREAEIGVFFGYVMDRIGPVTSGHADYERLLKCPDIDFLISPGTYRDREIGGGSGFLTVSGSERLAGKGHLHECDQRTHTYNRDLTEHVRLDTPCWPDTKADIAGMRRELALCVIKQSSLWWFDMWGGFYQEPELLENLAAMKNLWDRLAKQRYEAVEEVALIVDPDSLYYFNQRSPRQGDFTLNARKQLNRLGVPYETYSLNDIPTIPDLARYKLLVFSVPLEITPAKAELLKRYVLNHNRTILWLYAPGLSDGQTLDPGRVKRWAGVEYGTPGLTTTPMDGWLSAYLHAPETLTPAMLKGLAETAGVHLYCQEEQPLYANDKLVAIHTASGGRRQIKLRTAYKRVTELFSGGVAAENTDVFTWDFASPDTALFALEA